MESTIVGIEKNTILIYRQGGITIESLKKIHPYVELVQSEKSTVKTSGMDLKHYAPQTKLLIVDDLNYFKKQNPHLNVGILDFKEIDNRLIAKDFYQKLYDLDKQNFDVIVTKKFKDKGIGKALNDKLKRASTELKKLD